MPTRALLSVCLIAAFVSGCATPQEVSPASAADPPLGADEVPVVTAIAFAVTGTGLPTRTSYGEPRGGSVEVSPNASTLLMEARWTCEIATSCDLDLVLFDPEGVVDGWAEGSDGSGSYLAAAPTGGTWTAQVWPGSEVVRAAGEIRVTQLQGALPPGYSAFP